MNTADDDEVNVFGESTTTNHQEEQPKKRKQNHPKYKEMYYTARGEADWAMGRFIAAVILGVIGWIGCVTFFFLWL